MIYLRSVDIKPGTGLKEKFPFNLQLIKKFKQMTFDMPITIFVGENGSGKSTLIESIAYTDGITRFKIDQF
jgi:predicted ATPase